MADDMSYGDYQADRFINRKIQTGRFERLVNETVVKSVQPPSMAACVSGEGCHIVLPRSSVLQRRVKSRAVMSCQARPIIFVA